eukprot:8019280-Prorocentrum_lima.AAC.1
MDTALILGLRAASGEPAYFKRLGKQKPMEEGLAAARSLPAAYRFRLARVGMLARLVAQAPP